jgi:hypothetical protein
LGDNAANQQGFSMDLSGDGLSLVVSCPGGDNGEVALTGLVKVFSPSACRFFVHPRWIPGHLRLFDLTGGSWVQYGSDIDGENSADRFGNIIFSVTLTSDGSRVASGSTLYGDAGRVRDFCLGRAGVDGSSNNRNYDSTIFRTNIRPVCWTNCSSNSGNNWNPDSRTS